MKTFFETLVSEFMTLVKNKLAWRIMLALFLFGLMFAQIGINNHKVRQKMIPKFQQDEIVYFNNQLFFRQYASAGFQVIFIPHWLSVFTATEQAIPYIASKIDSTGELKCNHVLDGQTVLKNIRLFSIDFSGVVYFIWSLMSMIYGWALLKDIDFMKMLSSGTSPGKLFLMHSFSRILILAAAVTLEIGGGILLTLLNGVSFTFDKSIVFLWGLISLNIVFFFFAGTAVGNIRKKEHSVNRVLIAWFLFFIFLPFALQLSINIYTENFKTMDRFEKNKYNIISIYEKRSLKKFGRFYYKKVLTDEERKFYAGIWDNELKKIFLIEDCQLKEIDRAISIKNKITALLPTIFFFSSSSELSGTGDKGMRDFYAYSFITKKQFFYFFVNEMYISKDGSDEKPVTSFIKGNENLYWGKSVIPANAFQGLAMTILYSILLMGFSFFRLRRKFYEVAATRKSTPQIIDFQRGAAYAVKSDKNRLFTLFSIGKKALEKTGFAKKISVDDEPVGEAGRSIPFVYACNPAALPTYIYSEHTIRYIGNRMKVSPDELHSAIDELRTIKRKSIQSDDSEIKENELVILTILRLVKKDSVLILNNPAHGSSIEFGIEMKQRIEELKKKNVLVLYLCESRTLNYSSPSIDNDDIEVSDLKSYIEQIPGFKKVFDHVNDSPETDLES